MEVEEVVVPEVERVEIPPCSKQPCVYETDMKKLKCHTNLCNYFEILLNGFLSFMLDETLPRS